MPIKVTVIGGAPSQEPLRPTRLGEAAGATSAAPEAAPLIRPTAFQAPCEAQPLPAATPPAKSAPSAIPAGTPQPKAVEPPHLQVSVLPGTPRKTVVVTPEMLSERFPGIDALRKSRVQAVLAGVSPAGMNTSAWLSFGIQAQEEAAALVKERLHLMESAESRSIAQHLSRLQRLLGEVLEAVEGGFLRKSPRKAWDDVSGEVRLLEGQLSQAYSKLSTLVASLDGLVERNHEVGTTLSVQALAAEYLIDRVTPEAGALLVSRHASLSTSQALTLEQVQTLELEKTTVQELAALVQDGVLLKLPAVYSQLAGLSAKPSDTERFMTVEKLSEIVHRIQRNR